MGGLRTPGSPRLLRTRMRHLRRLLTIAMLVLVAAIATSALATARTSSPPAARAHAASSYITGIGDQQAEMFSNPLWRQLHTKISRYIAPYDAVAHPYSLNLARIWIHAAERQHQQVLVAF